MSRNSKIREVAEKLPPYPKLKHGRRVQRDSRGQIIYVDHFRELKKIQLAMERQGYSHKHEKTLIAFGKYALMVNEYEQRRLKPRTAQKWGIAGIMIIAIIFMLWLKKEFNLQLY